MMRRIAQAKLLFESDPSISWAITFGYAVGVAIVYFTAARLGLALLTKPEDAVVVWPASGVAVGILITFGRRAGPAVVVGVMVATVAANLMGDKSIWTSLLKGFCDLSEALMVAWLLKRWFGWPFTFGDLRHVLGFVAAGCFGAAFSALGGAAITTLLHTTAPFWDVWRAWFLADGIGIALVAPLVIGLGQVWRDPPTRAETIEGIGAIAFVALISMYIVSSPTGSWLSFDPDAVVLALMLWLTTRCQPTFGIAGAFVASITVVYATIFGVGHFGDGSVPIIERVGGAQTAITTITFSTLVLAGLFTERRRNELALRLALSAEEESKARLADAMAAGQVSAFEWNAITGLSLRTNAARILGFEQCSKVTGQRYNFLRQVHADDRECLATCIRELCPTNPSYALTFRFVRPDRCQIWLEETAKGEFDETGRLLRVKGLTRDITERKRGEEHERTLNRELDHRVKNVLATVSAIIAQTRETSSSHADFVDALNRRIQSLASAHELLSHNQWRGVSLSAIIERELAPYTNAEISGPSVRLEAEAAHAVAMVLHELTTNAAKYGAFSNGGGRVVLRWWLEYDRLAVEWREIGGPPVLMPSRTGYGTSLIRELIPFEFGGTVDLAFMSDGLRCRLEIPANWASGGSR